MEVRWQQWAGAGVQALPLQASGSVSVAPSYWGPLLCPRYSMTLPLARCLLVSFRGTSVLFFGCFSVCLRL